MNKTYLLLIVLSFFSILSYAQKGLNMIDQLNLKQDIITKDKKIYELLKKDAWLKEFHRFQLFHVFWLEYKGEFKKEDFIDHTFLNKLVPTYYTKNSLFRKKTYLNSEVYIGDSTGNLIAETEGGFIQSAVEYKVPYDQSDIKLFDMFYKKELDFVFYIYGTYGNISVGVKSKDIYILDDTNDGLKVYPLEEFVDCCWEKFYHR